MSVTDEFCEHSAPGHPGVQCPRRWTHEGLIPDLPGTVDRIVACSEHARRSPYSHLYHRTRSVEIG